MKQTSQHVHVLPAEMAVTIELGGGQDVVTRSYPVRFKATFDLDMAPDGLQPSHIDTSASTIGGVLELAITRGKFSKV